MCGSHSGGGSTPLYMYIFLHVRTKSIHLALAELMLLFPLFLPV